MNSKLIQRLKNVMDKKEISPAELSRLSGITPSSISDYLTGKYEPKQDKIDLIARALNISPAWLMGWEDENGLKIPLQIIDSNTDEEELPVLDDPEIRALARKDSFKSNPKRVKKLKGLIKFMLENDGDD